MEGPEILTGPLHEIFPDEWIEDREKAYARVRFYTSLFIPREQFFERAHRLFSEAPTGQDDWSQGYRVIFGFGTPSEFQVVRLGHEMYADESGVLRIEAKADKSPLPDTTCVILGALEKDEGLDLSEGEVHETLDRAAAVMCLHTGKNMMWQAIYEGQVRLSDGQTTVTGPAMRVPQPVEGPFLHPQNGRDIKEILARIRLVREPRQGRIRLATQLMDHAMRSDHGFFEYWTALEVLCNGKAGAIKRAIADLYGIKSHRDAAEQSGLSVLAQWRHDFFHRGLRPNLSADVERLIQLIFLDLLRAEIDLEPRYHLAALLNAEGVDLSPVGLPDRRTGEQGSTSPGDSDRG